jgi:hypothetical protein
MPSLFVEAGVSIPDRCVASRAAIPSYLNTRRRAALLVGSISWQLNDAMHLRPDGVVTPV